LDWSRYAGV